MGYWIFGGAGAGAVVDGGEVAGEPDVAFVVVAFGGVDVVAVEDLLLELVGGEVLVEEGFGVEEGGEDLVVGDGVFGMVGGGVEAVGGGLAEEGDGFVDGVFEVGLVSAGRRPSRGGSRGSLWGRVCGVPSRRRVCRRPG